MTSRYNGNADWGTVNLAPKAWATETGSEHSKPETNPLLSLSVRRNSISSTDVVNLAACPTQKTKSPTTSLSGQSSNNSLTNLLSFGSQKISKLSSFHEERRATKMQQPTDNVAIGTKPLLRIISNDGGFSEAMQALKKSSSSQRRAKSSASKMKAAESCFELNRRHTVNSAASSSNYELQRPKKVQNQTSNKHSPMHRCKSLNRSTQSILRECRYSKSSTSSMRQSPSQASFQKKANASWVAEGVDFSAPTIHIIPNRHEQAREVVSQTVDQSRSMKKQHEASQRRNETLDLTKQSIKQSQRMNRKVVVPETHINQQYGSSSSSSGYRLKDSNGIGDHAVAAPKKTTSFTTELVHETKEVRTFAGYGCLSQHSVQNRT